MRPIASLLAGLSQRGIELRLEGERLKFSAPRGALTAELRDELKLRKADVIAFLRRTTTQAGEEAQAIPRAQRDDRIPLSFSQQRLWFLDQLDGGGPAYNLPAALKLLGDLNLDALNHAFSQLLVRHESLRTHFREENGEPLQVIREAADVRLPVQDLTHLPEVEREDTVRRIADDNARDPFDLASDPLLRVKLIRLAEEEHVLLLTLHHIIADGWSIGVMVREMAALYAAYAEGKPSPLPEPALQFADFAYWQRDHLSGENLERQLGYWKQQLQGAPPLLNLPADRPRPAVQSFRGGVVECHFSPELTAGLKTLCRETETTLFMMLHAAFAVLLCRHSGTSDVVVGSSVAKRTRKELEPLIGLFVNNIAIRTQMGDNPTFRQLLARVRSTVLGSFAHQDLPFHQVVDALRPERSLSHSPVFQVLLDTHNTGSGSVSLAGLQFMPLEMARTTAMFDLSVEIQDTPDGLVTAMEYSSDLFDRSTIRRLGAAWERLLEGAVAVPDTPVELLPLLSDQERRMLLVDWNHRTSVYPVASHFAALFEAMVRRRGSALAMTDGQLSYTYDALNRAANRLAHLLVDRGVGPEMIVPLMGARNTAYWTMVVAILKAGGAYMPLDPAHPPGRIAMLLETCRSGLILSFSPYRSLMEDALAQMTSAPEILFLDDLDEVAGPDHNLTWRGTPQTLAYVLFTSGSTGKPKGAMLHHAGMINHLSLKIEELEADQDDTLAQNASQSFDISIWQAFVPLLSGGVTHVFQDLVSRDPVKLLETVDQWETTLLEVVPSQLQVMLDDLRHSNRPLELKHLRYMISNGEALPASLCREWFEAYPHIPLWNMYGPTECSDDVLHYLLKEAPPEQAIVPIGAQLPNLRIYVLDPHLNPVPIGVPGQVFIAGIGVGRGYLNSPERTADIFIPDPYTPIPGGRLYKTGDLARTLPDGNILFLGRIDFQVKLRGQRLELGEIEAVLASHDQVRETLLTVFDHPVTGKQLLAYVTAQRGRRPEEETLRGFLADKLPSYMVPSVIMILDAFPLTQNGKVDRRALPLPDASKTATGSRDPETPVEQLLAGVWSEVLNKKDIKADVDFFEMGGHSLLATQVVSRIRRVFNVELSLRDFFEAPVIEDLARMVERVRKDQAGLSAAPMTFREHGTQAPLSFAQQRLWFLDRLSPGNPVYNIPSAMTVNGPLNGPTLEKAFSMVVDRHQILRTLFAEVDGQARQRLEAAPPFKMETVDFSHLSDAEAAVADLAGEEAIYTFDLERGPLFRATLVRLSDHRHALLVNMHHIISDGWSIEILIRELTTLYGSLVEGRPNPLPRQPLQYADYAVWQREEMAEAIEDQVNWWRERLAGAPPLHSMPTDRPRPLVRTHHGAVTAFRLGNETSNRLRDLGKSANATLFMTLQAAFCTLIHRYGGQDDVVIGAAVANRNHRETEGLMGFLVNTLALRLDLSGDPAFLDLVRQSRDTDLEAFDHQDAPFERVVEAVQPVRSQSFSPIFQIFFDMENVPAGAVSIPGGLSLAPINTTQTIAKFDLNLTAMDHPDGVSFRLEYNTDLYDAATVEAMTRRFTALLEDVGAHPEKRLSHINLLDAETLAIMMDQVGTAAANPSGDLLHDLFQEQARRNPNATALEIWEDGRRKPYLSYGELDRKANGLARLLRLKGVGPEKVTGVLLPRSPQAVVAILGTLKAGGAWLFLDPRQPVSRVVAMARDAQVVCVIANQEDIHEELAGIAPLVAINDQEEAQAPPEGVIHPQNTAYLTYTSGSTGTPKGVAVSHSSACGLLKTLPNLYKTQEERGSGAPLFTSLSFDGTIATLWTPLLCGEPLALLPQDADPASFAGTLAAQPPFRFVKMTPAHLAMIREARTEHQPAVTTPTLVLGGDALHYEDLRGLETCRLVNQYGPTETTVACSAHATLDTAQQGPVSIGQPLAGATLLVLDAHLQWVAQGMTGELYIGGPGLARGYHGQPALTAQRFLPNPHGGEPGGRLYRSGDLVVRQIDGLYFRGRADHQVKVRGFRIEPGEIEAVLKTHPQVNDALVVCREPEPGFARLDAYAAVGDSVAHELTRQLKELLQTQLPDYMNPSSLTLLESVPLTPNGKPDRAALPEPATENAESDKPMSLSTGVVCAIWAQVLGLNQVGPDQNFFDLGGHSLIAVRVVSRLREHFSVDLPLGALFANPTPRKLATGLDGLTSGDPLEPILPAPKDQPPELSFSQERLWFLDQMEPGSSSYNIPAALRLSGHLDVDAFNTAMNALRRRHHNLRSRVVNEAGSPRLIIDGPISQQTPLVALDHLGSEAEVRARALADSEAVKPFHLEEGGLLRVTLIRLAVDDHVLLITMHHMISDAWSMDLIIDELTRFYASALTGEPLNPQPLTVQYTDYAAWQRKALIGPRMARQLAWWKHYLAGAPAVHGVPLDGPRPVRQSHSGGGEAFSLSSELSQALRQLFRRTGATPFIGLLAGFYALLARYSGEDDLVVGAPVTHRNRRELEPLIGFFANTLALRADLSGDPSFTTAIHVARKAALDGFRNQDIPFERVVDTVCSERNLSHTPLFQIMFTLTHAREAGRDLDGLTIEAFSGENWAHMAKFDLTLTILESADQFQGVLYYNRDLFLPSTVQKMTARFKRLLSAAVAEPEKPLSRLDLSDPEEPTTPSVLTRSSHSGKPGLLHKLFEARALQNPDVPALKEPDGDCITAGQLHEITTAGARVLAARGVKPDGVVGICLPRSLDAIISMLAVLKAGGAYLPLDPQLPEARQKAMLQDAGADLVICRDSSIFASGPATLDPQQLRGKTDGKEPLEPHSDHLAYVIFTSGSTGKPKGVGVSHGSAFNLLSQLPGLYGLDREGERRNSLLFTSLSFDGTVASVWAPLIAGHCLTLAPEDADLEAVSKLLSREDYRFVKMTPSHLNALRHLSQTPFRTDALVLGGEALFGKDLDFWRGSVSQVINQYGPTEATVACSAHVLSEDDPKQGAIPIGKALGGADLHVLGKGLAPVFPGAVGQLFIGGPNLARGYLRAPGLTAQSFVPNPFGPEGERLYRTGDKVRTLENGELVFLGRTDHQVKLRGYRIELGEIEAILRTFPAVKEARVVMREDQPGDQRLTAYVVPPMEEAPLTQFLGRQVPSYMKPAAYVFMDALPLTANGKLDRAALPQPTGVEPVEDEVSTDPNIATIKEIWAKVLGVERVGVRQNFFTLGGHSLLAARVVAALRAELGVEVPLRLIFEYPTIAELSTALALDGGPSSTSPIAPRDPDQEPVLSFAQERLWFIHNLQENAAYNIPIALILKGPLNKELFSDSVQRVALRHQVLGTAFPEVNGVARPVYDPALLPKVHLGSLASREAFEDLARKEAGALFHLAEGPLVKLGLYELGPGTHGLIVVLHHIIADGWSVGVLIRELAALYKAGLEAKEPELPDLPIQYQDYAAWQKDLDTSGAMDLQRTFWVNALKGAPPLLKLPLDHARPAVQSFEGDTCLVTVNRRTTSALRDRAAAGGATLFMVLQASFAALLSRYTSENDLVIGVPVANRNHREVEPLIGFFVNTLALRHDLSGDPSFAVLLERVREFDLRAFANQDLPFEQVVNALDPRRSTRHAPIFQVLFSLQNAHDEVLTLPGLALERVTIPENVVKFDLTLDVMEAGDVLHAAFSYNKQLFERSTVERLAQHWLAFLDEVCQYPDRRLSEIRLITDADRTLLDDWNQTARAFPDRRLVHGLFEDAVEKHGDETALLMVELDGCSRSMTYDDLNERANAVAAVLAGKGCGPETTVGLYCHRSLVQIVGLLGILKAGAAYVPLDPDHPSDRVAFMLQDAGVALVVTGEAAAPKFPETASQTSLLVLDREGRTTEEEGQIRALNDPAQTAYVMYTSGSTGRPKGVKISHGAICNRLLWSKQFMDAGERFMLTASFAFDISLFELMTPLMNGGAAVLPPPDVSGDPATLIELTNTHKVTHVHFLPSMLDAFLEQPDAARANSLTCVFCGGEAMASSVKQAFHKTLDARLIHFYGPTEASINLTAWDTAGHEEDDVVSLGSPISNACVHLLSPFMARTPPGAPGEIHLGGQSLASGYHKQPALTAERFIPNRFGPSGSRLYRTGDLGKWSTDGRLTFLGRVDHQVKIRGFRIEPDEIAAVIAQHPEVDRAVVAARTGEGSEASLVAYLRWEDKEEEGLLDQKSRAMLTDFIGQYLPEYMQPNHWVALKAFPLNANGKLDQAALPEPDRLARRDQPFLPVSSEMEQVLARIWQDLLGKDQVSLYDNFFDLGGHSILLARLHARLKSEFETDLKLVDLFRFPTIHALAQRLEGASTAERIQRRPAAQTADAAVVGYACRFPGAPDAPTFWDNLRDGVESITFFTREELLEEGESPELLDKPHYVPARPVLDDIDQFDNDFFQITPKDALTMDPQHRLFMETVWHALEHAGRMPENSGEVGLYAGLDANFYLLYHLLPSGDPDLLAGMQSLIGNDKDFLTTRTAYKLNLKGPAVTVQTACSTSLTAIHMAWRSLCSGECDLALAGGVSVNLPQKAGYLYREGLIKSRDGHCRAFDAEASGTLGGSGVGVVVLKPLDRALEDGDMIHAVVKGSALNNDGSDKIGFTAPSVQGQTAVISHALQAAGVSAESLSFVEAHGTGTNLGDPIEVTALTQAFATDRKQFCGLGSVKSNFGHLNAAAGVAGFLKATLSLKHGQLPPSLHFERPNPEIDLENSPFYVNRSLKNLEPQDGHPLRCGVSSFGIGGANVHVVLEQAPALNHAPTTMPLHPLLLSARCDEALNQGAGKLADFLEAHPETHLTDAAFTLAFGRRAFKRRAVVICTDREDAVSQLRGGLTRGAVREGRGVVFMFPGQGSQRVGMCRDLYQNEPVFKDALNASLTVLDRLLDKDPRTLLFPEEPHRETAAQDLQRTRYTQPLLFAVEYALAGLYIHWGLRPKAMLGHSIGEYVAACLAGVLSLDHALALTVKRGALMDSQPGGVMLTVSLSEEALTPKLGNALSLAAVNGPQRCVVAGPEQAVVQLERDLNAQGVVHRRLVTSHAFHSAMMDPVREPFLQALDQVTLNTPKIPFLSNLTGTWITPEQATDPNYWADHLRGTVRFSQNLACVLEGGDMMLELGPGRALSSLAGNHPLKTAEHVIAPVLAQRDTRDHHAALTALGRAWSCGVPLDWSTLFQDVMARRTPLPGYAFQRKRFWVERARPGTAAPPLARSITKQAKIQDWFYTPSWKQTPLVETETHEPGVTLFLGSESGLAGTLVQILRDRGETIVTAIPGDYYDYNPETDIYYLNPGTRDDYHYLAADLVEQERVPDRILHGLGLEERGETDRNLSYGFFMLASLADAVCQAGGAPSIKVLTAGLHPMGETAPQSLAFAALQGALRVIPQEYPGVTCAHWDLTPPPGGWRERRLAERLVAELNSGHETAVVFSGDARWVGAFEPLPLETGRPIEDCSSFLITGGFGKIGAVMARHLTRPGVKLALLGRSAPSEEDLENTPEGDEPQNAFGDAVRLVRELRKTGAEVLPLTGDVTDRKELGRALEQIHTQFGELDGVVHCAAASFGEAVRSIKDMDQEAAFHQMKAKIYGAEALRDLLMEREELKFVMLFSSLAAELGGLGFAAYAAANAYLDTLARHCSFQGPTPWISVNWDGWDFDLDRDTSATHLAMTPEEGMAAFDAIVNWRGGSRVCVSTGDLNRRVGQWVRLESLRKPSVQESGTLHARPDLSTAYEPPRTELETLIVDLWHSALGLGPIGIYDDFFELGGDSLLALQVFSGLHEKLGVNLPMASMFQESTVAGLSGLFEAVQTAEEAFDETYEDHDDDGREAGRI